MSKQRRTHSDAFKAKVALEVLKGEKTLSEIASQYEVHQNLALKWKRELEANASRLFERGESEEVKQLKEEQEKLYKAIGQRQMEIDWLKKKLGL